ncbi:uncharacterized protein LOC125522351 [Triticum urartu]|uniref:uncharacterized protein LOC125522351 n=1 Tax=Triticum urartu TaxID=4572 RepID=UPI0020438EE4|nr:uncharacterized protein LOC125522351 [Triticum urartu]
MELQPDHRGQEGAPNKPFLQDRKGIVEADLCLCKLNSKEPPPKIYEVKDSNCISCPLGHTWVGCQQPSDCASGPPLRVSVGQLFFSFIAVQLLTSKLLCFSTRINSRAVDIPYSSKDMPKVKQKNSAL